MPLVTIAIPTYKRSALLKRALGSAISQTYSGDMEILVVENPSEDAIAGQSSAAEECCRSFSDSRIRYVLNANNLGMVGNWNHCFKLSRGRWVVILHDDDWLSPYHIETLMALAAANPDLRLVGCEGVIEREGQEPHVDGRPEMPIKSFRLTPFHFLLGNPFFASGVMLSKATALALGGFDNDWFPTMDHQFWLQCCEEVPCARVQYPLLHYYIGDNASLQPAILLKYIVNDWQQRVRLLERHFSRCRVLKWYSRAKVDREQIFLERLFKTSIDSDELHRLLAGAGWRAIAQNSGWAYFPVRAILEAWSIVFSKRLRRLSIN